LSFAVSPRTSTSEPRHYKPSVQKLSFFRDPAYVLHPAILDAALHTGIHPMMTNNRNAHIFYLPASVQSVTIHDALLRGMPEVVFSHITKRKWTPRKHYSLS
jgi:hypothetical protein